MNRIVGIGAGGHAAVVIEAIRSEAVYEVVALVDLDNGLWGTEVMGVPVMGGDQRLVTLRDEGVKKAFIGFGSVGSAERRRHRYNAARDQGFELPSIVHRAATLSPSAILGDGTIVCAAAVVNTRAQIGENVIVNTGAIVEHDCVVEDHVHLATGVRLAGGVIVEEGAHVGIGAAVREGSRIGARAVVGAGAAVVRDVPQGAVVVGVPARNLVQRHS